MLLTQTKLNLTSSPPPLQPAPPIEKWSPSKVDAVYKEVEISEIKAGPGRITFMGRIANVIGMDIKAQKASNGSKLRFTMAVADGTGVIEVRLYLKNPCSLPSWPKLGGLVRIHATFVAPLTPKEKEAGTVSTSGDVMISISDTDAMSNVEFVKEDEENWADYRVPVGGVEGLIPLRSFVEGAEMESGKGVRVLVGVKWKGPRKNIQRKDGSGTYFEKRDIGIFDCTMEAVFSLCGSVHDSALDWEVSETILLIENPKLNIYNNIVEVRLGKTSLLTVNPCVRNVEYLRTYAARMMWKNSICPPFPEDLFNLEEIMKGEELLKYTFGDIDRFSRDFKMYSAGIGKCVGVVSVVITEMNMYSCFKKNMLITKTCCGHALYGSTLPITCPRCDESHFENFVPNPDIIGRLSDETGSVPGKCCLWSPKAWESFLGPHYENFGELNEEIYKYFDEYFLFVRLMVVFGWDVEVGRIAVVEIIRV